MEVHVNNPVSPMLDFDANKDHPPSAPDLLARPKKEPENMTILANGTVMKVQKLRQRRVLSCVYCHSKKIKCSRHHPECLNCQRLGMVCKYFINKRVSRGRRKSSVSEKANSEAAPIKPEDSPPRSTSKSAASKKGHEQMDSALFDRQHDMLGLAPDNSVPETYADAESNTDSTGRGRSHRKDTATDFSSLTGSSILSDHGLPASRLSDFLPKKSPMMQTEHSNISPISEDSALNYHNLTNGFPSTMNPFAKTHPLGSQPVDISNSSLLQAPILNSYSNNITNKFFNTNYDTGNPGPAMEEHYSFNLSSFSFTSGNEAMLASNAKSNSAASTPKGRAEPDVERKFYENRLTFMPNNAASASSLNGGGQSKFYNQASITNFVDGHLPTSLLTSNIAMSSSTSVSQKTTGHSSNLSLQNSLNPLASNPATTVNYLYGTNVHYDNANLLLDLVSHLPTSRERSYELIERYINSVHILLPILVNLNDLLLEHDKYWNKFDPYVGPQSPQSNTSSSKQDLDTFDFLQFYTLYFPVLYASTISEFEEYDNLLLNQDIDKYLKAFNMICQHYNYPHGLRTIPLLLGNVIIQSTSPNPSTMEMSQIIRYAKFLQLHKDPLISLRISDWKVVKFRRMLWWVIFGLDALSSHNFCLPPVCKFEDFNVLIPEDQDPIFNDKGAVVEKRLNVSVLAMTVKFNFDRILSDLVYHLHNGLALNISSAEVDAIKDRIVELFHFIDRAIQKVNEFYKLNPPTTVQEMNIVNFVKNHSWSFVDRAMMLLHKKILLADQTPKVPKEANAANSYELTPWRRKNGTLALSEFEDTFGRVQESNIIKNVDNSSILQLRFKQNELFAYENMQNNLIPSILHNLNDFLKYNDFIKFGKFNWYIKRTIPLDSIILLLVIICVKFKYDFMAPNELLIYVKLINKALFIFNRKYFKNEKYKRMLSLTNLTWEFILKRFDVVKKLGPAAGNAGGPLIEFVDHQVSGILNMSDLFSVMKVPQPSLIKNGVNIGPASREPDSHVDWEISKRWDADDSDYGSADEKELRGELQQAENTLDEEQQRNKQAEIMQLKQKIYYDLRNNFVDINDYCTFYSSLENVLHELMDFVNNI